MRAALSWPTRTPVATCATMPPGNFSTAAVHSSTSVSPIWPQPFTSTGSRKSSPAAAPAIRRANETG